MTWRRFTTPTLFFSQSPSAISGEALKWEIALISPIDVSTPADDINAMKKAIQVYIESKPKYWNPKHAVVVKEIENMDKMNMILCVQHTMNHQNYGEKSNRRSELVLELKRIFENLGIRYNLLPQELHVTQLNLNNNGRLLS
ncbi:hypothetical protein Patl1_23646 [Pistacia atlantica]|uniref:Uncharacterized protein n=1 Tax=Pistacia atlantica TaxID=434234 RepID=A0ACC0ZVP3_9ROSI|nr:hypothetical protein Patl1_23646 [Pistacia atlantica]